MSWSSMRYNEGQEVVCTVASGKGGNNQQPNNRGILQRLDVHSGDHCPYAFVKYNCNRKVVRVQLSKFRPMKGVQVLGGYKVGQEVLWLGHSDSHKGVHKGLEGTVHGHHVRKDAVFLQFKKNSPAIEATLRDFRSKVINMIESRL